MAPGTDSLHIGAMLSATLTRLASASPPPVLSTALPALAMPQGTSDAPDGGGACGVA